MRMAGARARPPWALSLRPPRFAVSSPAGAPPSTRRTRPPQGPPGPWCRSEKGAVRATPQSPHRRACGVSPQTVHAKDGQLAARYRSDLLARTGRAQLLGDEGAQVAIGRCFGRGYVQREKAVEAGLHEGAFAGQETSHLPWGPVDLQVRTEIRARTGHDMTFATEGDVIGKGWMTECEDHPQGTSPERIGQFHAAPPEAIQAGMDCGIRRFLAQEADVLCLAFTVHPNSFVDLPPLT